MSFIKNNPLLSNIIVYTSNDKNSKYKLLILSKFVQLNFIDVCDILTWEVSTRKKKTVIINTPYQPLLILTGNIIETNITFHE